MNESIQSAGGKARAKSLSQERRTEIATQAAEARWQKQKLQIPLADDSLASIPFPMSEEDFTLLIQTLDLWKKKMVTQESDFQKGLG